MLIHSLGSGGVAKLNEYLRVGEAAELLGVSKDYLRRWDAAGKLRAHRHPVSNFRLYLKKDLDALLTQLRKSLRSGDRSRTKP